MSVLGIGAALESHVRICAYFRGPWAQSAGRTVEDRGLSSAVFQMVRLPVRVSARVPTRAPGTTNKFVSPCTMNIHSSPFSPQGVGPARARRERGRAPPFTMRKEGLANAEAERS